MALTRNLMIILVAALLTMWAIIATQLHFSATENFRSFDGYTRDMVRERVDSGVAEQALRMQAETHFWMAQNQFAGQTGLAAFATKPPTFPEQQLRQTDVISLIDLGGNVVWSKAHRGDAWDDTTLRGSDGSINPAVIQTNNKPSQHFFLNTAGGPQLAFSTRVVNTETGTTEGYLMVAQKLNKFFYAQLLPGNQSLVPLFAGKPISLPAELEPMLQKAHISSEERFKIERRKEQAFVRYDDPFGTPVLLLGIETQKYSSTLQANPGMTLFFWFSAITIVYLFIMGGVVHYMVGEPLRKLRNRILSMSGENTLTLDNSSKNEIDAIEDMFAELVQEREKRESSLRYFASAVEATDDAIAILNWEGKLKYVNPSYEEITGRSAEEIMEDASWWDTIFTTNSMRYRDDSKDEWEGELQIKSTTGEIRIVEATTYKLEQLAVNKAHFVLVMHDITEKYSQIAEIKRLATAVESIEDCIIIADHLGCISYANPAYEKRCGKKLEEIRGIETNKLSHAASPIKVYEDLQRVVMAGQVWRGELQAVFGDGNRVIDEAVISPVFNGNGDITNYVTTLHDVTGRVTMEEHLRLANNRIEQVNDELEERVVQRTEELHSAKEIAEQANVAKSAFLATVSHEIRTPLNGILGMLELMGDYPLDPSQKRLLGSADTSANLLLTLINDILDFSKIEAGELTLDETTVSLRDATESVVLSLTAAAHRKQIHLQSSLDPSLPDNITIDGIRLQQLLWNLIGNALKFTDSEKQQGVVTLTVEPGPDMSAGPTVQMHVSDNGIGIPPEAIKSLFKPFTQAESSTTRRFGGTGLGLSISSRLANLMGGKIEVESSPGEGSTFTITLPLVKALDETSSNVPQITLRTKCKKVARWSKERVRGHILVAEDNLINQDVIKLQLKAIGYSCDLAEDGETALQLWRENEYDLVLTDCHMPNMDGFELARAIRLEEHGENQIPILALTANVLSEEAESCRKAGMDECLTKPIERWRLDKALAVHLTASAVTGNSNPKSIMKKAASSTRQDTNTPKGLLDMDVFAANIGDDYEVQRELLLRFAEEAEKNLAENREALNAENADVLECNAHKLKSAARTIGAERLASVCVEIEQAARIEDFLMLTELLEQKAMLINLIGQQIRTEVARKTHPNNVPVL